MTFDKTTTAYFMVGKPYTTTAIAETIELSDACKIATAIAMHYGMGMEVSRMIPDREGLQKRVSMFSISPSLIDWRRVEPEHMLLVKNYAHDLVPNVHELLSPELEGATK